MSKHGYRRHRKSANTKAKELRAKEDEHAIAHAPFDVLPKAKARAMKASCKHDKMQATYKGGTTSIFSKASGGFTSSPSWMKK